MKPLRKIHFDDRLEQPRFFTSTDPPGIFAAEPFRKNKEATEEKTDPRLSYVLEADPEIGSLEPRTAHNSSSWQPVLW